MHTQASIFKLQELSSVAESGLQMTREIIEDQVLMIVNHASKPCSSPLPVIDPFKGRTNSNARGAADEPEPLGDRSTHKLQLGAGSHGGGYYRATVHADGVAIRVTHSRGLCVNANRQRIA